MKKLLALMMALVMTMSLVTISNAAFSDADTIEHDEAVDVMNTLGVINGMGDGSFAPKGNVTRAQMAKMIAIIMLGDVDGAAFVGTSTDLTDIAGHWAEGFIKYCYSQGVIAGKGEGKFDPNANVTAAEAAKMLLVAIGYNATVQGYVGTDWQIAVARDAQLSGFYEDLKGIGPNAVLTRDQAAQMIYNAVVADMIKKTPTLNITTGSIQYTYEPDPTKSLLSETFGAYKVEGIAVDNEFMSGTGMKGKTEIVFSNEDEVPTTWSDGDQLTFNVDTGANELGKSITLYVKLYKSNASNADKAVVLGSAFINDNNDIFTTGDEIKANKIEKKLKDQGLKIDGGDIAVLKNYAGAGTVDTYAELAALTGNGIEVSFVDYDGDSYIDTVLVVEMSFGQVSAVSTKGDGLLSVALRGSKGAAFYENEANDNVVDFADLGLEKDDYVTFIYVAGSELYYVAKAEGETVSVSSTVGDTANDGGKFVAAGTTYKKSALAGADIAATTGTQGTLPAAVEVGKDAVVYLDDYGYVMYVTDVESTTTYLMVTDVNGNLTGWGDKLEAKVILSDGTTKTVEIAKLDGDKLVKGSTANGDSAGTGEVLIGATNGEDAWQMLETAKVDTADNAVKIYSYTVDTDGKYELTTQTTNWATIAAGGAIQNIVTKNDPTLALDSTLYANNGTPFVVKAGSDVSFYTGINNVPTRANSATEEINMFAVKNSGDNFASIVFVIGGAGSTSSDNYMYFLKDQPSVTSDGKGGYIYTYDVVRNGVTTTIEAKNSTVVTKAGLYKVTFSGDKADSATNVPGGSDPFTALTKATVAENGVVNAYFCNADTKFLLIKDNEATEVGIETIITAGKDQDWITVITGENSESSIAKYVFIDRDSSVAAPATVTYDYDSAGAVAIGTTLSSPAASKNVVVAATAATGTTVTNVAIDGAGTDVSTAGATATYATVSGDIPASGATNTLTVTVTVKLNANGMTKDFTYTLTMVTP